MGDFVLPRARAIMCQERASEVVRRALENTRSTDWPITRLASSERATCSVKT